MYQKKIKSAKTDSHSDIGYDPENRPEVSNLVTIYSLLHEMTPEEAVQDLSGLRYGDFKQKLGEDLNTHLAPFRERRAELVAHPQKIMDKLEEGRERTYKQAQETLDLVKNAMHLIL